MQTRHRPPGVVLYTPAWVGLFLAVVVLSLGVHLILRGAERGAQGAPRPPLPPAPRRLLPRQPGLYEWSLAGRRVAIDPGHGGADSGAVGKAALPEKAIALDTALRAAALLEQAGARVVMTRRGDLAPGGSGQASLEARVRWAVRAGAEVLVSLHADASPDPGARGVTTYYYRPEDALLAQAIQEALVARLGAADRGVRQADFYVLRASPVPAVLVELGFVTHPGEAAALSSPAYRQAAAQAVVEGLARYFASAGGR